VFSLVYLQDKIYHKTLKIHTSQISIPIHPTLFQHVAQIAKRLWHRQSTGKRVPTRTLPEIGGKQVKLPIKTDQEEKVEEEVKDVDDEY
jgi:hypothetical protein